MKTNELFKRILHPSGIVLCLLAIAATALLIVVFSLKLNGILAYFAYALSAYALTALCINAPEYIRKIKAAAIRRFRLLLESNKYLSGVMEAYGSYDVRARLALLISLTVNLIYAVFKLVSGLIYSSAWLASLGVYYAALSFIRFNLLRHFARDASGANVLVYKRTAWFINFLTLAMSAIFAQTVLNRESFRYPGILIYVMAIWAFYKIISAVINLIKRRKDENLLLSAARFVSFACALMSILALQTAMISEFGGGDDFGRIMNAIAGAVISLLMITLSAYMIINSREVGK